MDWNALLSAFGLVFLAELGDKTQLAVVAQTCKYAGRPWAVFLGASVALTAVTAVGAIAGQLLHNVIPATLIRGGAAAAFVLMGLLIARQAARSGVKSDGGQNCAAEGDALVDRDPSPASAGRAFGATLGLLFVAELGDKTQLAVLSMASGTRQVLHVFLGGVLALVLVTALGVLGGQGLSRLIPERTLLWLSAAAFVIMGILMAIGAL